VNSQIEDPIDEKLTQEVSEIETRREKWLELRDNFLPLVRRFKGLEIEPNFDGRDINLSFSGDKTKLTSVIRILRTNGFDTDAEAPKANSNYWSAYFTNAEDSRIQFWISFSSTVCRMVKVGTKMVEQDVYEVQCD
jgi:hypothetical protein